MNRTIQKECPKCGKLNTPTTSWAIHSKLAKNIIIYSFKCSRCKHHWKEGVHRKEEGQIRTRKTTEKWD